MVSLDLIVCKGIKRLCHVVLVKLKAPWDVWGVSTHVKLSLSFKKPLETQEISRCLQAIELPPSKS